jgi:hypothetical protein
MRKAMEVQSNENAAHGSLDEGHWPTATERQRAAAIEHLGSRRLLIRF